MQTMHSGRGIQDMETAEGKVTRKKKYEPTDEDYSLQCVRIEHAENGVVVCCEYGLDDEARDKARKSDNYPESYCSEKTVFENKQDAKAFIMKEFDALFGEE